MKRTPIRKVSKKRSKALAEYRLKRADFLAAHPFCMVWLNENGFDETDALSALAFLPGSFVMGVFNGEKIAIRTFDIPKSTEIHHVAKRYGSRLNDESKWLAVSREMHEKIEMNKSWARERGYLDNI